MFLIVEKKNTTIQVKVDGVYFYHGLDLIDYDS